MQDDASQKGSGLIRHLPSLDERLTAPPRVTLAAASQSRSGLSALGSVTARLTGAKTKCHAKESSEAGPRPLSTRRKLTPLKRLERYVTAIFKLGRTEHMAKDASRRIERAEQRMDDIKGELGKFDQDIREVRHMLDLVEELRSERALLHVRLGSETYLQARIFADLSRRIDLIAQGRGASCDDLSHPKSSIDLPASVGFKAFQDSFYHRLENRYRGSVEQIADRLRIYIPDVEAAVMRTGGKPVMDIGCGRGEWLGLLKRAGIEAFGVDINPVQIEAAKEKGLDLRIGDALKSLGDMENDSLAMISAHHLVEHLPFDAVAWIAREAQRVLAPGGVLLVETPNTRNVLVGATTFHTDPTHLKPMPEQVLTVLFETAGFYPVEVRALNPHSRFREFLDMPDVNNELAFLLFGPQDLAVLGTKTVPKGQE